MFRTHIRVCVFDQTVTVQYLLLLQTIDYSVYFTCIWTGCWSSVSAAAADWICFSIFSIYASAQTAIFLSSSWCDTCAAPTDWPCICICPNYKCTSLSRCWYTAKAGLCTVSSIYRSAKLNLFPRGTRGGGVQKFHLIVSLYSFFATKKFILLSSPSHGITFI